LEAGLVAVSAVAALATAFFLRTRLHPTTVVVLLAATGGALGWGAMLLQPHPSIGEVVAAVAILAILVPAHVRIVLGPFGPR
jgi:hypothetical protein